ncbi:hypothetical protein K469DRAFT_711222 [Zopfia rhizophila CBS 207.26]|uniref:Uncharacterized protein n=1 Tax=Zopfia rhizophila CBS 207.26 TaxID=1314779 RepID=A0A6A6DYF9_9PEZI|nr:hypothetical protein K469DRAFT_711222 [Zopfia rhizophila CBS 207.26]
MSTTSPSISPARRVLGDLTPKAINTPSKQYGFEPSEALKAHSPLKQMQTLSPQMIMNDENMPRYGSGRKRSIYEVEGAENVESAGIVFAGHNGSLLGPGVPVTVAALSAQMGNTAGDLIDDGELTPTEPDTPEPEELEPPVSQDTSASKESFSWCVDYNPNGDSQTIDQQPQPISSNPSKTTPTKAEKLRLRLQFALYKVRTNQTQTPLAELALPTPESTPSLPSLNASTATTITSSAPSSTQPIPDITVSPTLRESVTHVVANIDSSAHYPKLAGGPVLLPTAYSSRMIHDYHVPSSPPVLHSATVSPERLMSPTCVQAEQDFRTPVAKRRRAEEDEEEIDGEREGGVEERLQRLREKRFEEGDLTSSVVKGRAASGLLELMRGPR